MFKQKIKHACNDLFGYFINIDQINHSSVLSYKGITVVEVGAFYCPYIPLTVSSNNTVTILPTGQINTLDQILKVYYDKN